MRAGAASKVRCDYERPCFRCISRCTPDQCVDRLHAPAAATRKRRPNAVKACAACHDAKVACANERPCPRCVRLGQVDDCVIVPRLPHHHHHEEAATPNVNEFEDMILNEFTLPDPSFIASPESNASLIDLTPLSSPFGGDMDSDSTSDSARWIRDILID